MKNLTDFRKTVETGVDLSLTMPWPVPLHTVIFTFGVFSWFNIQQGICIFPNHRAILQVSRVRISLELAF